MAEPTLKDVLKAIAELNTKIDKVEGRLESRIDKVEGRLESRIDKVEGRLESKIDLHRAETKKGFADLDEELDRHAGLHQRIEKDIEMLKKRLPAAPRPSRAVRRR